MSRWAGPTRKGVKWQQVKHKGLAPFNAVTPHALPTGLVRIEALSFWASFKDMANGTLHKVGSVNALYHDFNSCIELQRSQFHPTLIIRNSMGHDRSTAFSDVD